MRSTKHPTVHFLFFYHSCSKDREGAAGKGNDGGRQTHPTRRTRAQYKKNFADCLFFFFFFSAEEQPLELPEQSKLRPEDTQRERLVRHFPNYHQKKNFFFLLLFMGTPSDPSTTPTKSQQCPSQLKKKKARTFVSCTHFTFHCPRASSKVQFFSFFFISLPKSFFNFCSRYLLRNRMCGQAKLPGPEVQLQKIYSRHPLDFS